MTEPTEAAPEVPEVGWRVIDPDGNVVDSGPGMVLIAVGDSGPAPGEPVSAPDETEEA